MFEKPLPITLIVAEAVCTGTLAGFTALIAGPALMVNVDPVEVIPPEATVIDAEPVEAIMLAGTEAVTCVAELTVVARAVPFHQTTEPELKPVPVTAREKAAPPVVAELGFKEVILGRPLIVKPAAVESAPP